MKVAIIGANGQLGTDVARAFRARGDLVCELNHDQIEVAEDLSVGAALERASPDLVINTAAMHHVEKCESDPMQAYRINAVGAGNVARACQSLRVRLVHISTDYVFDGAKQQPYLEEDSPMPLNVYGNTKLSGEYWVRATLAEHFVLRVSGIYGHAPCRAKGSNFVETMLRLARERDEVRVVDDEVLTPTSTAEIARQIIALAQTGAYGLYHATAEGACSWHEFAREIFALAGVRTRLSVARPGEFPVKTPRPKYSVLANGRLKRNRVYVLKHWKDGLAEYIAVRPRIEELHDAKR